MATRTIVLQLLLRGPSYGVALRAAAKKLTKGMCHLREGTLYPTLHKLERQRLVKSVAGEKRETGGRPRRHYSLTEAGKRAAQTERTALRTLLT